MQIRFAIQCTGEDYVNGKQWRRATLDHCPWHPEGGCGFSRHGTYPRVRPRGTLIPRWYCPLAQRTVSALPDWLAVRYSGTLPEIESQVLAVESAPSLASAANSLRADIELPGALRYLSRLCKAVHGVLRIARGLQVSLFSELTPTLTDFSTFSAEVGVLVSLRQLLSDFLWQLPAPLGFGCTEQSGSVEHYGFQHKPGADPPCALPDASV